MSLDPTGLYAPLLSASIVAFLALGLFTALRLGPVRARAGALALAGIAALPGIRAFGLDLVTSLFAPTAPGVAVMVALVFAKPWLPALRPASRVEAGAAVAAATLFWAMALGVTAFDPYALFYRIEGALAATGAFVVTGAALGRPLLALLGPLGLAAWSFGLTGDNAADALLHPLMLLALLPRVLGPVRA